MWKPTVLVCSFAVAGLRYGEIEEKGWRIDEVPSGHGDLAASGGVARKRRQDFLDYDD